MLFGNSFLKEEGRAPSHSEGLNRQEKGKGYHPHRLSSRATPGQSWPQLSTFFSPGETQVCPRDSTALYKTPATEEFKSLFILTFTC